ncbi:MAG: NUDIX hydrolase [Candidatus Levybacteria bacterium]|nr:NUDIX hydrolase [Candidatus Levybacteria bacterium]
MKTKVVVIAIVESNGKILMGQKKKNVGPYPNAWRLPGGGVEEGETLEEAITREVKEETGLKVVSLERIGFDEDNEPDNHGEMTHYVFLAYRAKTTGEPKISEELVILKWIGKSELKKIRNVRPGLKLFKELGYL